EVGAADRPLQGAHEGGGGVGRRRLPGGPQGGGGQAGGVGVHGAGAGDAAVGALLGEQVGDGGLDGGGHLVAAGHPEEGHDGEGGGVGVALGRVGAGAALVVAAAEGPVGALLGEEGADRRGGRLAVGAGQRQDGEGLAEAVREVAEALAVLEAAGVLALGRHERAEVGLEVVGGAHVDAEDQLGEEGLGDRPGGAGIAAGEAGDVVVEGGFEGAAGGGDGGAVAPAAGGQREDGVEGEAGVVVGDVAVDDLQHPVAGHDLGGQPVEGGVDRRHGIVTCSGRGRGRRRRRDGRGAEAEREEHQQRGGGLPDAGAGGGGHGRAFR